MNKLLFSIIIGIIWILSGYFSMLYFNKVRIRLMEWEMKEIKPGEFLWKYHLKNLNNRVDNELIRR